MVLAPLLAAPAVMLVATAVERRFGATVAGAVASAPLALAIVILTVGVDLGAEASATLAATAAAHVVAQIAFAAAFAFVVARGSVPSAAPRDSLTARAGGAGVVAGIAAFVAVSLAVEFVPAPLAIAAAVPALLVAPRFMRHHDVAAGNAPTALTTAVGAGAAVLLVGTSLTTAELAGPVAAGTIGAFPAVSTALALVLAHSRGGHTAANSLRGLVGGLRGYAAFCLLVAAAAPQIGVVLAVALGLAACAAQSFLPRNSVRPGGLGSSAKPRLVYSAIADALLSLTSSSIRRQPRARARSKAASVSARPRPVPRAASRT
jgi:hypothetical protein